MAQEEISEKIKTLLIGGKQTLTEISRILEVDSGTVYRVKKIFQVNFTLKHKPRAGRPNLLSNSIKYTAPQLIKSDPETSIRKLTSQISTVKKIDVSKSIVHLTLQKLQYSKPFPDQIPLLSEKNTFSELDRPIRTK